MFSQRVYAIPNNYALNSNFIDEKYETHPNDYLVRILEQQDKGYHLRLEKDENYKFFGDLDHYNKSFDEFKLMLVNFLAECYNITIKESDIKHTYSKKKDEDSYHYVIPSLWCNCKKNREIVENLKKKYGLDSKQIDTSVYCNKWFRLPNQTNKVKPFAHKIINGSMIDFIFRYIDGNAKCIDNAKFIDSIKKVDVATNVVTKVITDVDRCTTNKVRKTKVLIEKSQDIPISDNFITPYVTHIIGKDNNLIQPLKDCITEGIHLISPDRNGTYEKWINIGFLYYKFGDYGINLWKEFSKMSSSFDMDEINRKLNTFNYDIGGTELPSLFKWVKEDNNNAYNNFYNKYKYILPEKQNIQVENKNMEVDNKTDVMDMFNKGQGTISENYCAKVSGNIIVSNNKIYIWNDKNNMWELKKDISIMGDIHNYINCIINKKIRETTDNNQISNYIKTLKNYDNDVSIKGIYSMCVIRLTDDTFYDKLDSQRHTINFQNGIYDMKKGIFRARVREDYISKCLPFDYNANTALELNEKIRKIIHQICNDNDVTYDSVLRWLSYCMTGETIEQKFMIFIGHTAQNGKSTLSHIFSTSLPIYSVKIDNETFNKNYTKAHKQFARIKKPIRFIQVEELDRKMLDIDRLKDFVSGVKICNEIMYGTTEEIEIHSKINFITNKDPIFESDKGMYRRGLMVQMTNKFVTSEEMANKPGKGIYLRDNDLLKHFETDDNYKMAFINILLPYANMYYKTGLKVDKKIENAFKELCDENDNMGKFLDEYYEITNEDKDRVHKDVFLDHYNVVNNSRLSWGVLMGDVKKYLTYDRYKKRGGKKGCIMGIKQKDAINDLDDNDEDNE